MLLDQRKNALTALPLLAALGLAAGLTRDLAAAEKPVVPLSPAEFDKLKPILDLKNQPWATIPWKYSITEACKLAAATNKPIFMVVNTGNALGCT